ncbi:zinc-ribbon domain-containing protein [Tepidimonas ignava]|uniref:zinc-ribbon domain-containing protein n=1 Tax=Tepidimonas ignava TaxID=114249 RepID=UPI001C8F9498|nr:zinc-ribbon domain-containing protein [Tepidimonas ignava]
MRFVTRCPSCGTSFRVVVDQLKIADGWARCGWCQHVFDATQDLQPEPALAPGQPPDARVLPETTATPAPTAAQHLVEPPPAGGAGRTRAPATACGGACAARGGDPAAGACRGARA